MPTEEHHQKVRDRGGRHKATLDLIKGGVYSVPAGSLEDLADDPDVAYITPDRQVHGSLDYATVTVGANLAYKANWTGKGVGVAVLDSGLYSGWPDVNGRVVYSQDFGTGDPAGQDLYGHGSHVAAIIGGAGTKYDNYLHRGIAPGVNLIVMKVLNQWGSGTDSSVIAAINQAITLKSKYNIRVMNLSLGRPVFESYTLDPLCQAVEAAWKAGIVVVVAAGSDGRNNSAGTNGYGTIAAPGNDPYVIAVGAMNMNGTTARGDDVIASYSSKGPTLFDHIAKPDLVAPGNRVVSLNATSGGNLYWTYPSVIFDGPCPLCYIRLSGTSMATPMVSGAAAILLQQNSKLTPDQVKARLMKTASKTFPAVTVATDAGTGAAYTSYYDLFTVGAGYLDIMAALNSTDTAASGVTALSPAAVYDPSTGNTGLIFGSNVVWGTNGVWGSNVVWGTAVVQGTNVVWGTNGVWGSNIVWGDSTTAGFNVVWGTNGVWGTGQPTGESIGVIINGDK